MLDHICFLSKNLYNAGLYVIKQEFLNTGKWIRCTDLNKKMVSENNPDFRALSGSSSQQILMGYDLEKVCHHNTYVGKRLKRGIFRTKDGVLLNADVNGSYNIMRKVKGDAVMPPYTGFGYNPVKKFIN